MATAARTRRTTASNARDAGAQSRARPRVRTRHTIPPHHATPRAVSSQARRLFIPVLTVRPTRHSHNWVLSCNLRLFSSPVRDRDARNAESFRTDGRFLGFFRESARWCEVHGARAPRRLAPSGPSSPLREKHVDRVSPAPEPGAGPPAPSRREPRTDRHFPGSSLECGRSCETHSRL